MDYLFEIAMEVVFDAAMFYLMFKTVIKGGIAARLLSVTVGIGFIAFAAFNAVSGAYIGFILALLGFMLSYSTFVFTFSRE